MHGELVMTAWAIRLPSCNSVCFHEMTVGQEIKRKTRTGAFTNARRTGE